MGMAKGAQYNWRKRDLKMCCCTWETNEIYNVLQRYSSVYLRNAVHKNTQIFFSTMMI